MNRAANQASKAPVPRYVHDALASEAQSTKRISQTPLTLPWTPERRRGEVKEKCVLKTRQSVPEVERLQLFNRYPAEPRHGFQESRRDTHVEARSIRRFRIAGLEAVQQLSERNMIGRRDAKQPGRKQFC